MLRAYKFRLYPNAEQRAAIVSTMGACRFVYNWSLELCKNAHEVGEKRPSAFDLNKRLTVMKQENLWLYDHPNQSLQFAIRHMDAAYQNFFRSFAKKQGVGFPRFKSRKNPVQSYQLIRNYRVDFDANRVKLPKIVAPIRAVIDRRFAGTTKTATVSLTPTGKFFLSVLVDDGAETPEPQGFTSATTIGIDLGITDLVTLSTGEKVGNPKHIRSAEARLAVLQRRLSRKQKGSANRKKAVLRVAKAHEKVANQRAHFLHNLSLRLVRENQAIAVEDLNVKGMMANHSLAKSIGDASWAELVRQLEYKARWAGKTVLKIGRFEPSSKTCSACGHVIDKLPLSARSWDCPGCGAHHDRDVNAAINIKQIALDTGRNPPGEPVDSRPLGRGMKQEFICTPLPPLVHKGKRIARAHVDDWVPDRLWARHEPDRPCACGRLAERPGLTSTSTGSPVRMWTIGDTKNLTG